MTTEYLLNREIGHILAALTPQNALIMEVVLQTGLRISDVLELRTEQLRTSMWVREKKTGKMHRCGIPKPLLEQVFEQAGPVWAFPGSKPGQHKTRQAVWKDIKRAEAVFKRSGALSRRQNLGTHTARKYAAVGAYHRGGMAAAQRLLNHSDPLITRLYALADMEVSG